MVGQHNGSACEREAAVRDARGIVVVVVVGDGERIVVGEGESGS